MGALLELEGVTAGYGGGDILHELDLAVEEGAITCIVGPNGAGKSTVLRVVSGLLRPRLGRIHFRGASLVGLSPHAILRRGIVQVPQERSLFPTMSVWENVRLGAYTVNDRALVERRLQAVCDTFPIVRSRRHEPAASLSGGQQKIVEFARALMLDPALLILDEATSSIDTETEQLIQRAIERVMRDRTSIVVAHRLSTIQNADRIIVLHHGEIREQGTHQELLAERGLYWKLYKLQYADLRSVLAAD